jgi:serine-type D-Ala-D-Ala carboxypeptidase (penicillin-binding protein 5/6)
MKWKLIIVFIVFIAASLYMVSHFDVFPEIVKKSSTTTIYPKYNGKNPPPVLDAASAFAVYLPSVDTANDPPKSRVLFDKNSDAVLPIASITKLMTALVADEIPASDTIVISQKAIDQYETAGKLKAGQKFTKNELLYPLLIESSNDAAYAFAEYIGYKKFLNAMNVRAKEIGMASTTFYYVHGLDGVSPNTSTVKDLYLLAAYILKNKPFIFELTTLDNFRMITKEGTYNQVLKNTNSLLRDNPLPIEIVGGKTGETPKALQTLLLVVVPPNGNGYIIATVLKSKDRARDMTNLLTWVYNAYTW